MRLGEHVEDGIMGSRDDFGVAPGGFWNWLRRRTAWPRSRPEDGLVFLREHLLYALLLGGVPLSLAALLPSLYYFFQHGWWGMAVVDVGLFGWALGLLIHRGWSYRTRALGTIVLPFALGTALIWIIGPISGGPLWLLSFSILTAILLGGRWTLFSFGLNAAVFLLYGWALTEGAPWTSGPGRMEPAEFAVLGANFIFLNLVTGLALLAVFQGLEAQGLRWGIGIPPPDIQPDSNPPSVEPAHWD
jgi:hypothetical protein